MTTESGGGEWSRTRAALHLETGSLTQKKIHKKWRWSVEGKCHVQQRELVLPPDESVLLVNQHEPLLHHGLLLFLVVA